MIPLLIGSGLLSLYETIKGQSDLNKLNSQPAPQFTETPEMMASRQRADHLAQAGFTPAEKAGFRKNVAEDINTKTSNALSLGGGSLAKTIGGIGKIDENTAENKFATSDAALHRQNIHYADKFSEALQALSDRNISEQTKERLMAEERLGGAVQTGLSGLASTANLAQILSGNLKGGGGSAASVDPTANYSPNSTRSYYAPTAEQSAGSNPSTPSQDRIKQILDMLKLQ